MSVRTSADDLLDQVDRDLLRITRELSRVALKDDTLWGSGDYSQDYYRDLLQAVLKLQEARWKLNR